MQPQWSAQDPYSRLQLSKTKFMLLEVSVIKEFCLPLQLSFTHQNQITGAHWWLIQSFQELLMALFVERTTSLSFLEEKEWMEQSKLAILLMSQLKQLRKSNLWQMIKSQKSSTMFIQTTRTTFWYSEVLETLLCTTTASLRINGPS